MKKLFLLLALLGMVAVGCSKDDIDKSSDNKTEQPDENEDGNEDNIPENIFFGLDKESVTISPDGGSVDVIVYSNYKWEISGTSDWCTPSVKGGDANEDGQKVTFSADVAYDDREATFWFRCADKQIKFVVSQKFKETIIPDANNTFNIPAEGGVAILNYQTSVDCEVIIPEEAQDWITIAPATRGLVSENINLDIAENTTYSARTAVIKVVAKDNAEIFVKYTINQEQKDGVLVYEDNTFNVYGVGGSVVIKYQANVDCDVIIPDDAQSWISLATSTRGLSTYSTTLNIAENNSGKERSCVVKVTSQGDNELFAEYTIVQNPICFLYYTSSNGEIVTPYNSSAFGATILSNTYKDGVGVIEFDAPITTIGDHAFYRCTSLTSVTIPDSVTTIGEWAFAYCSSLTSVTIPDSVTTIGGNAFSGCISLTSVTIPDSVTTIGYGAFYWCESLTSVTIPDSVTTIGGNAFRGCISLTSVTIGDSVTTIGNSAFSNCNRLTSVTTIGNYAFYGCGSLTSVTIGDSVTTIGDYTFGGCSSLTSVTIGNSVTTIGDYAFSGCKSLTSVYISDIAAWCDILFSGSASNPLYYANNLYLNNELVTDLIIPNSVTTIGDYAFNDCESLTSVTIGDSITTIGKYAFNDCESLTSITIPDSVTTIGGFAFAYCDSLTSVTIPNSVTMIGYGAFAGCNGLKEFKGKFASEDGRYLIIDGTLNSFAPAGLTEYVIPDSVTTIGDYAFYGCSSLTSVTIPDSVTEIGYVTFAICENLNTVYCKAINPPTTIVYNNGYWFGFAKEDESGYICNIGCTIYVPTESVNKYKSADGWNEYASDIVGYNF